MTQAGIDRYRSRVAKGVEMEREDGTAYGTRLLDHHIGSIAAAVGHSWPSGEREGRAEGAAYPYLKMVNDSDLVGYLALKGVLRASPSQAEPRPRSPT